MVNSIAGWSKRRVIVIVPRRLLAISIGTYMKTLYSGIGIATEGYKPDPGDRIIYCTVQSYLSSEALRSVGSIVVLDEAHIEEPHYIVVRRYLLQSNHRIILQTATPLDTIPLPVVDIVAVNQHTISNVKRQVKTIAEYMREATMFVNDRLPSEKVLIFIDTRKHAYKIASSVLNRTCILTSKNSVVDETASVFIATSVADAGLTIPDVSFVLTLNFSMTVLSDVDLEETGLHFGGESTQSIWDLEAFIETGRLVYFYLSPGLLKQRAGRTGRTTSGVSIVFELTQPFVELTFKGQTHQCYLVDEIEYNIVDYIRGCAPATSFAFPFFPDDIKEQAPKGLKATLKIWDSVPAWSWNRCMSLLGYWFMSKSDSSSDEEEDAFLKKRRQDLVEKYGPYGNIPFDKDEVEDPDAEVKDIDDLEFEFDPELDAQNPPSPIVLTPIQATSPLPASPVVQDVIPPDLELDVPDAYTRIDVPGTGLLCGAKCISGILYTIFGTGVTDEYTQFACEMLFEDLDEDEVARNFTVDTLWTILSWQSIDATIYLNDELYTSVLYPDGKGPNDYDHKAVLYLDTYFMGAGHYNYLGMPALEILEDLDEALERFPLPDQLMQD